MLIKVTNRAWIWLSWSFLRVNFFYTISSWNKLNLFIQADQNRRFSSKLSWMFLPSIILHFDEKQDPDSTEKKTDEFKWDMEWKQKTICYDGEQKTPLIFIVAQKTFNF